ncbi:MAG: LuxR C-terminal-related transcriptional regulator [Bacteroidota bacterium]
MEKVYDTLYKLQGYLLGIAIFVILFSVAIKINNSSIELLWKDYPLLGVLILLLGLVLVLVYIQVDKHKLSKLRAQIEEHNTKSNSDLSDLLSHLTKRQREVYDQIVQGKSNKEIMYELYIEASTLKTHINQIYKKLDTKNRQELRRFHKENVEK